MKAPSQIIGVKVMGNRQDHCNSAHPMRFMLPQQKRLVMNQVGAILIKWVELLKNAA